MIPEKFAGVYPLSESRVIPSCIAQPVPARSIHQRTQPLVMRQEQTVGVTLAWRMGPWQASMHASDVSRKFLWSGGASR